MIRSYIVTGVTGGSNYLFRIRARNIYGYGPFSSNFTIIPQDVPGQVTIPVISILGVNVVLNWD